jgi:hypothetical protein
MSHRPSAGKTRRVRPERRHWKNGSAMIVRTANGRTKQWAIGEAACKKARGGRKTQAGALLKRQPQGAGRAGQAATTVDPIAASGDLATCSSNDRVMPRRGQSRRAPRSGGRWPKRTVSGIAATRSGGYAQCAQAGSSPSLTGFSAVNVGLPPSALRIRGRGLWEAFVMVQVARIA